jgi:hypothetical protein
MTITKPKQYWETPIMETNSGTLPIIGKGGRGKKCLFPLPHPNNKNYFMRLLKTHPVLSILNGLINLPTPANISYL